MINEAKQMWADYFGRQIIVLCLAYGGAVVGVLLFL